MLDLNIVWYYDMLDHKLPLKFEIPKRFLCHMIRGKLLPSYVRGGKHPYTILNGWYGTMVCSSGGCYTKACPEPFGIATRFLYSALSHP